MERSSRLVYVQFSLIYISTPPWPSSFCNRVLKSKQVNYGFRLYCIAENPEL